VTPGNLGQDTNRFPYIYGAVGDMYSLSVTGEIVAASAAIDTMTVGNIEGQFDLANLPPDVAASITNALQIGGLYEVFSTNNWAPAASNYLGTIQSYAGSSLTVTSTVAENLMPPPSVDIYISTDGTTWTQGFTNVPVLLSVTTALTNDNYAVSNLTIFAYANPATVDAVTDARDQTILVDTPLADADTAQIANVEYVTARRAELWSGYPATSTVNLMSQLLDFGGGWRMQSSGTNWQFRVAGVPVMDASAIIGSATNLVLTNWVALTNAYGLATNFSFTILDAGDALISVETSTDLDDWLQLGAAQYTLASRVRAIQRLAERRPAGR
jgi:hypothetical protein